MYSTIEVDFLIPDGQAYDNILTCPLGTLHDVQAPLVMKDRYRIGAQHNQVETGPFQAMVRCLLTWIARHALENPSGLPL